jgi:HKD family nuclease
MATKEFILQGFTNRSHKDVIRSLFGVADINRVLISAAFVTEYGVRHIEDLLLTNSAHVLVFAGVRNDITSYQGMLRLKNLPNATIYAVDTGSRGVLFHPKIYMVKGANHARAVIGSANLTLGGINNNIEGGMSFRFDLGVPDDLQAVNSIEQTLTDSIEAFPNHVIEVTGQPMLEEMLRQNRLIDEDVVRPPRPPAQGTGAAATTDTVPHIQLRLSPLRKPAKKKPISATKPAAVAMPAPAPAANAPIVVPVVAAPLAGGISYKSVWQSKPLSHRSLNLKKNPLSKTNPTGSTTLGKGVMVDIDPVTYFRNDIFGHLPWAIYKNRAGNDAEFVDAEFDLFIKGTNVGRFTLTLRHSFTRAAAAADDHNLPTELSWNEALSFITRTDLLERTMTLLIDLGDPNHFAIEID